MKHQVRQRKAQATCSKKMLEKVDTLVPKGVLPAPSVLSTREGEAGVSPGSSLPMGDFSSPGHLAESQLEVGSQGASRWHSFSDLGFQGNMKAGCS